MTGVLADDTGCKLVELLTTAAGILAEGVVGELVPNDVACELSELLAAVARVLAELLTTTAGILADEVAGELVPNGVACKLSELMEAALLVDFASSFLVGILRESIFECLCATGRETDKERRERERERESN